MSGKQDEARAREFVVVETLPVGRHGRFRGEGDSYRVLVGHMDALTTTCRKGADDCAAEYARIIADRVRFEVIRELERLVPEMCAVADENIIEGRIQQLRGES